MPDTTTVEGTIKKVTKKDGEAFGLTLDGHEGYLNYSKEEYRQQPWDAHKEGDYVKLAVADGKWISKIKVTVGAAEGTADNRTEHAPVWSQKDRESSIARSVALKAAVDFAAISSTAILTAPQPTVNIPTASDVVMNAEFFLSFLEGAQSAKQPEPPDSDPGWE